MPPLPLLRLPQLVLHEIFRSLSIGEKIKLSLCSKKISTQINNAQFYSQKVLVDLDILNQNIRVHSKNDKDIFDIFTYPDSGIRDISNTEQCSIACYASFSRGIQILWKNHQERFLFLTRNLLKMFQCKVTTNISWYNSDLHQPIVSMLLDMQVKFKTLTISLHGSKDEILFDQISSNFGLVEELRISPTWVPGFRPFFTLWPQKITIMNSAWFTLEYLLACISSTITLGWSHLENKDLDVVLRKWKAGGFPYLEYLSVEGQSINNEMILGMHWRQLRRIVIQTDDGSKTATINADYGLMFFFHSHQHIDIINTSSPSAHISCSSLDIAKTFMGNQYLNEILGKWSAGGLPNLECLITNIQIISNYGANILAKVLRSDYGMGNYAPGGASGARYVAVVEKDSAVLTEWESETVDHQNLQETMETEELTKQTKSRRSRSWCSSRGLTHRQLERRGSMTTRSNGIHLI